MVAAFLARACLTFLATGLASGVAVAGVAAAVTAAGATGAGLAVAAGDRIHLLFNHQGATLQIMDNPGLQILLHRSRRNELGSSLVTPSGYPGLKHVVKHWVGIM